MSPVVACAPARGRGGQLCAVVVWCVRARSDDELDYRGDTGSAVQWSVSGLLTSNEPADDASDGAMAEAACVSAAVSSGVYKYVCDGPTVPKLHSTFVPLQRVVTPVPAAVFVQLLLDNGCRWFTSVRCVALRDVCVSASFIALGCSSGGSDVRAVPGGGVPLPNHISWKRPRNRYMVQCTVHAFGSDAPDKVNVGDYKTLAEAMVADARMVTRLALLGHTFRDDGAVTAAAPPELGRSEVCTCAVWLSVRCGSCCCWCCVLW